MTKEVPSLEIVNIFVLDKNLIQNWSIFANELGLDQDELFELEQKFSTSTIKIKQVFLRVINVWVSKSGEKATLKELAGILRNSKYEYAAEKLEEKFRPEGNPDEVENLLGQVKIVPSKSPSLSSTLYKISKGCFCVALIVIILITLLFSIIVIVAYSLAPGKQPMPLELPEWHTMPQPGSNFIGRDKQLKYLNDSFYDQQKSGKLNVVLITGPAFVGKSELARHFVSDLWTRSKVITVWFNATNLQSELENYLSEFQLHINSSDKDISKAIRGRYNCQPWIVVIDHVNNHKSISYLNSVIEDKFSKFPPICLPFVIITSSNPSLKFGLHHSIAKVFHIELNTYGSLSQYISKKVTPWVVDRLEEPNGRVLHVCSAIEEAFDLLEKNMTMTRDESKAAVSLLVLLGHFVADGNANKEFFLVRFWSVALNFTVDDIKLVEMLGCFIKSKMLLAKGTHAIGVQFYNSMVQSVIRDYYLKHPGLNEIAKDLLGMDTKNEISIYRWLMSMLVEYFKQPPYFIQNVGERVYQLYINKFMEKVTKNKELVTEFKIQIVNIWGCCWTWEQLVHLHRLYEDLFGKDDQITNDLLVKLAWFHINHGEIFNVK